MRLQAYFLWQPDVQPQIVSNSSMHCALLQSPLNSTNLLIKPETAVDIVF